MPEIEWVHDGRRLLLPITVFPSWTADNYQQGELVTALLDTGATGTGIREDVAARLSLRKKGRRQVFTANGDIIANEYLIRLMAYPGTFGRHPFDLNETTPYAHDQELLAHSLHRNFTFALIVGMDVIARTGLHVRRDGTAHLALG